jgi:ribosome biogenesis GTPase A
MAINWFPGHMFKAQKKIKELLKNIDIVVEIVDARIPISSENPMIAKLSAEKTKIKILNKKDLADDKITELWKNFFQKNKNVTAIPIATSNPKEVREIPLICREKISNRGKPGKPVRILVMGIPNVGKSTFINILKGRNVAETSNRPAVTRNQQRIIIDKFTELYDTPGLLWPKIEDDDVGFKLAVTGAIRDAVVDIREVALYGLKYILEEYPSNLISRFKFDTIPVNENEALISIGEKRKCFIKGGEIDLTKASEIFLNEFRNGKIGKISLEKP